jgi:hypothetical protein
MYALQGTLPTVLFARWELFFLNDMSFRELSTFADKQQMLIVSPLMMIAKR